MFKIAKYPAWLAVLRLAGLLHGCGCHHSHSAPESPAAVANYQPLAVSPWKCCS